MNARNLHRAALEVLLEKDVARKCRLAADLRLAWRRGELVREAVDLPDVTTPGRPALPELVDPRRLPRRRLGSEAGRLSMIHAIAHIEFNAINLAVDAVYRYPEMPEGFHADWIDVAADEARHFELLRARLAEAGAAYGDFPAHDGLWDMALRTRHDPLARMALVPRVMEARGLDVTPGIMRKFSGIGDDATVKVLELILREEIGHVEAGTRWFHHLCARRRLEPEATYFSLLREYLHGEIRCPLHHAARRDAGFSENELKRLEELCAKR